MPINGAKSLTVIEVFRWITFLPVSGSAAVSVVFGRRLGGSLLRPAPARAPVAQPGRAWGRSRLNLLNWRQNRFGATTVRIAALHLLLWLEKVQRLGGAFGAGGSSAGASSTGGFLRGGDRRRLRLGCFVLGFCRGHGKESVEDSWPRKRPSPGAAPRRAPHRGSFGLCRDRSQAIRRCPRRPKSR